MAKPPVQPKLGAPVNVPRHVQITMVLAVVIGLLFVSPYFGALMFSGLVAFIFNPVYKAVLRRTHRYSVAILATLLTAFLSVLIPLAFVVGVTINQANTLIDQIQDSSFASGSMDLDDVVDRGTDRVNDILKALPGGEKVEINQDDVMNDLKKLGTEAIQAILNFIKNAGGAFFGFISTSILALFTIIAMLRYQEELIGFIKKLSPFHNSINDTYLTKAGAMTKAMVKGQLLIALCQGLASALSLWVVGIDYFWFFFVVLVFLSFIPLGGGILTLPIGGIMVLTGHIWQGLFIILFHLIVVSNIDNILRPRLVPKSAQLNSALTLLAVFSGLAVFGAPGVIYGPVVMILLITTFQMYATYNAHIDRREPPVA